MLLENFFNLLDGNTPLHFSMNLLVTTYYLLLCASALLEIRMSFLFFPLVFHQSCLFLKIHLRYSLL